MQDKKPRNDKGKAHGLWEVYYFNGNFWYKGLFLKGLREGPWEVYRHNCKLLYKCNYIKGELIGYYHENYSGGSIYETKFYAR